MRSQITKVAGSQSSALDKHSACYFNNCREIEPLIPISTQTTPRINKNTGWVPVAGNSLSVALALTGVGTVVAGVAAGDVETAIVVVDDAIAA